MKNKKGLAHIACISMSVLLVLGTFCGCSDKETTKDSGKNAEINTTATVKKVTLYSPDGRSTETEETKLSEYIANGWHTTRPDVSQTGYYVASPATNEELIAFANNFASELDDFKFSFSIGEVLNYDSEKMINGPEHDFGWDDEYIWHEITDDRASSLAELKSFWGNTFAASSADSEYFVNYTEKDGKLYRAQVLGLGGWMSTTYEFSNISRISETEVHITGVGYIDFDGDGKISGEDSETVASETFIMVLDNGRWKNKLALH